MIADRDVSRLPIRGAVSPPRSGRPALLVSVRDESETAAALAGGCDVLDVKEPATGSLGFAGFDTVRRVAAAARAAHVLCSAAFGEVAEWEGGRRDVEPIEGLAFAKLGLAGLGPDPAWIDRWLAARRRIAGCSDAPRWVAVAYADWDEAQAPRPLEVAAAARRTGCAGLLIDTHAKIGRTLFEVLSVAALGDIVAAARAVGLFVALAGGLREADIDHALGVAPDVIAVRTAACRNGDRAGPIDPRAVERLARQLHAASGAAPDFGSCSQLRRTRLSP